MAVKASATITLTSYRDTQSVTRYYKLKPAGSSAPLKPETKPPSSDWTDSEPACDISKELYFCDLTIFSNGEWEYSKVSKSTSYEAAKEAYHKAQSAKDSIDNLEIGGRNLFLNTGKAVSNNDYLIENYKYANEPLKAGEIYTASICVTPAENVSKIDLYFSGGMYRNTTFNVDGTPKQVISETFTMAYYDGKTPDIDPSYGNTQLVRFPNDGTVTGNTTVHWFKIEKGNKATDWTPAPEDVDNNVKDSIDNLEIGGRNLYPNSKGPFTLIPRNTGTATDNFNYCEVYVGMTLNETYTISVDVEITDGTFNKITVYPYPNGLAQNINIPENGRISYTFTKTSETTDRVLLYAGIFGETRGNGVIFRNLKIEKGNKATDWTPAPEDVDAGINDVDSKIDDVTSNIYAPGSTLLDGSKINDGSLSINQMDDTVAGTYSDPTTKRGTMEWKDDALHIKSVDSNAQNTYETVIGGDGIKFNWNGTETASIDQDELRINKTVVINAMEVGNWSWAIHPTTGNLMVKWNGGK